LPRPEFNIVIIGSGNMAHALGNLFSQKHNIVQVVSRNKKTGASLAKKLQTVFHSSLKDLNTRADFYFLCVPDDEIKSVSKKLKHVYGVVVHHSGSKPLEEIKLKQPKAVIYPFLSINKGTDLNQTTNHVFFQTTSRATKFLLLQLLNGYKFKTSETNDKDRAKLHLAAVLVNNFTNHLYYQAGKLSAEIQHANDLLVLLAQQAISNFKAEKTKEKQTGPARRKDKTTQKNHLNLIKNNKELAKIYLSLSQSITKTYNHE
jgi:Domain of unknown function (DUF2520)/NADP oxidoreductase coenzyme F420-dependent